MNIHKVAREVLKKTVAFSSVLHLNKKFYFSNCQETDAALKQMADRLKSQEHQTLIPDKDDSK